jgi:hypothetical protein
MYLVSRVNSPASAMYAVMLPACPKSPVVD